MKAQRLSEKLWMHVYEREKRIVHWCPGCQLTHDMRIDKAEGHPGPVWAWDQNTDAPTLSPSVHVTMADKVCHYFLRAGRIEFLSDSSHGLAGQTVELPCMPNDEIDEQ